MVRPRVVVEFIGGPADGTRVRIALDPESGRPPDSRSWTYPAADADADAGAAPAAATVAYELRESSDGRKPFWRYVLPGSSEAFGVEPDED